ncbi:hypothetical protein D910_07514 [Dendroctonus ponderosae]|uniref:Uncharacterized protein n=1 Tax=Dendroctonus ponderosae TaxID=77166 RepID=U4UJI4_DENPD|nr:hypothetical protein D910_07514 [Dendroctonus ponderosae]
MMALLVHVRKYSYKRSVRNVLPADDGAPAHFGQPVRNWLNQHFPSRWIGRGGPVNWPARSPDLYPLDYYLWGNLSNIIYATEVDSPEELLRRICAAGNQIKLTPFEIIRAT